MLSHAKAIEELGGGTLVATGLSAEMDEPIDREAVYKWRERGVIPPRYWPAFERLARHKNVEAITVEALEAAA